MLLKRLFIFALLLTASLCFGQTATKYTGAQHAVSVNFSALGATGTSSGIWVGDTAPTKHGVQVNTTGAPAACTYNLEGSLDNVNWTAVISAQACTTSGTLTWESTGAKPVLWVRFNLTALSASSTATAFYLGSN